MQNTIMTAPASSAWSTSVFEARMLQLDTRKLQLELQRITLASERADETNKVDLHASEEKLMALLIENAKLKEENLTLQKQMSVKTLHLASLEEDMRLRKEIQRCLHLQLASTEDNRVLYEQKIAELQRQIQKLQQAQHAEQFSTQGTLAAKDEEMGALHQQLSDLHQQITELSAAKTELQGQLSNAQREREASERAVTELTAQLAAANQASEKQKGAMEQLRNALTHAHSATAKAEDRIKHAQAETQIVQKEKESLSEMLQQARQMHQDLQQHLQMANEDRRKLSHEHTTFIETQLQSQINNLKTQLQQEASYREQSEPSLRRQLQEYQHKAAAMQAELDDARAKLGTKDMRIRQLQETVEELEQRQENRALDRVTKLISDIMPQHRDQHPHHTSHIGQHYGHTLPHPHPYQAMQTNPSMNGQVAGVMGPSVQGLVMQQPYQPQAAQPHMSSVAATQTQPTSQGHNLPMAPSSTQCMQLPYVPQNQMTAQALQTEQAILPPNVTNAVVLSNTTGSQYPNQATGGQSLQQEAGLNKDAALGTSIGSRVQPVKGSDKSGDNQNNVPSSGRGTGRGRSTGGKTKPASVEDDEQLEDDEDAPTKPKGKGGKGGKSKVKAGSRKRAKVAASSSSGSEEQASSSSSSDDNNSDQESPARPNAGQKMSRSKPAAKTNIKVQDNTDVAAKPRRGRPAKKQTAAVTEAASEHVEPDAQQQAALDIVGTVQSQGSNDAMRSNCGDVIPTIVTPPMADITEQPPVTKDVTHGVAGTSAQPVRTANDNAVPATTSLLAGIVTTNPGRLGTIAPPLTSLPAAQPDKGLQKQQLEVEATNQVEDMKSVLKPRAANNPMAAINSRVLKICGTNWQKYGNSTQAANLKDGSISGQVLADSKNRRAPTVPNFRADRLPADLLTRSTMNLSQPAGPAPGRH